MNGGRRWRAALAAAILAGGSGCGKKSANRAPSTGTTPAPEPYTPPANPTVGTDGKHVVLVLDDGFDLSDPVFQGKIVDMYTVKCDPNGGPADNVDPTAPIAAQKAAYLKAYQSVDSSCQVTQGLTFAVAPNFPAVRTEKARWNQETQAKSLTYSAADISRISAVLDGETANVNYHATATAGLIAYHNDVRLVAVEYPLGTPSDPVVTGTADCPTQAMLDDFVQLHKDPDVAAAYVQAPLDTMTQALVQLEAKYKVEMVNLSLGSSPLKVLTSQLQAAGCGALDYGPYFAVQGTLSQGREQHREDSGAYGTAKVLTVQAGGNDGVQIDDLTQAADCADEAQNLVMIGALDATGKRTDFSNFGKCVDFYMLGKSVEVAAPEAFVNVEDGTSFSTPLTIRYLTTHLAVGSTPAQLLKGLHAAADTTGNLLTDAFPPELCFDLPTPLATYSFAASAEPPALAPGPVRQAYDRRRLLHLLRAGGGGPR